MIISYRLTCTDVRGLESLPVVQRVPRPVGLCRVQQRVIHALEQALDGALHHGDSGVAGEGVPEVVAGGRVVSALHRHGLVRRGVVKVENVACMQAGREQL